MNRYILTIVLSSFLLTFFSCSKDNEMDETLGKPQYDLPQGAPGSADALIYETYQKYGTYILYDFSVNDTDFLWTGQWGIVYTPADVSGDKEYIKKVIEQIKMAVFDKFEPEFISKNFPYQIFLVNELKSNNKVINMASNGYDAIAIGNVGPAMDKYDENDWRDFRNEFNTLFTMFYYGNLDERPEEFTSLLYDGFAFDIIIEDDALYSYLFTDAKYLPLMYYYDGEDPNENGYLISCYNSGLVQGGYHPMPWNLAPEENQDYADFVSFLTTKPASYQALVFGVKEFDLLRQRALLLYDYLTKVADLDVVATQNLNCPDDKLPIDFFENLRK